MTTTMTMPSRADDDDDDDEPVGDHVCAGEDDGHDDELMTMMVMVF